MKTIIEHRDAILFALFAIVAFGGYWFGKQSLIAQLEKDVQTVLNENEALREVIHNSRFLSGNSAGTAIRQGRE